MRHKRELCSSHIISFKTSRLQSSPQHTPYPLETRVLAPSVRQVDATPVSAAGDPESLARSSHRKAHAARLRTFRGRAARAWWACNGRWGSSSPSARTPGRGTRDGTARA